MRNVLVRGEESEPGRFIPAAESPSPSPFPRRDAVQSVDDHGDVKEGANKRALYWVIAFLFLGGLAMVAGAAWSYADEHSGKSAKAKVTKCTHSGHGKSGSVYCVGTWRDGDQLVSGPIFNGRMSYEGETKTVRIHGGRATVPTLWVSIALAVMGLAVTAVAAWLLVIVRRGPPQPA